MKTTFLTIEQKVQEAQAWKEVEAKKARLRMSDAAKARSQGVENFPHPEKGKTRDLKPHLENIEKLYPEADF